MVIDLTVRGWIPKSGKIEKLCDTLRKLNLTEKDTVVIDPMSNSAFLGTDEDGLPNPIPATKSVKCRHWAVPSRGRPSASPPPPSAFKSCMKPMEKIIEQTGGAKIIFTVPVPRRLFFENSHHLKTQ
jgi:hypothetical protein